MYFFAVFFPGFNLIALIWNRRNMDRWDTRYTRWLTRSQALAATFVGPVLLGGIILVQRLGGAAFLLAACYSLAGAWLVWRSKRAPLTIPDWVERKNLFRRDSYYRITGLFWIGVAGLVAVVAVFGL